jgi:hypothetical protein
MYYMSRDKFDFLTEPTLAETFARDYLRQYYEPDRPVTDDEMAVADFVYRHRSKFGTIETAVDIGCGPTVHHAILLEPLIRRVWLADYLPECCRIVQEWVGNSSAAWDWQRYTSYYLNLEGTSNTSEAIELRERSLRAKVAGVIPVNLLAKYPLGEHNNLKFDLVSAFYCTEEVALTTERWAEIIARLSYLLNPNGLILLACLANTDFYLVEDSNGNSRSLPCARLDQESVRQVLQSHNFDSSSLVIEEIQTPGQMQEGVSGVIMAMARIKG